jgi:hypothetical protein
MSIFFNDSRFVNENEMYFQFGWNLDIIMLLQIGLGKLGLICDDLLKLAYRCLL